MIFQQDVPKCANKASCG